ncbi:MAG: EAL domain-containing protein [Cocleimonas sp.]
MDNNDLQCLFIGKQIKVYNDLIRTLGSFALKLQIKHVDTSNNAVIHALKKLRTESLVFISDEIGFPVELLSDFVWQYTPDALVIIVTEKTTSTALKKPFNNTQFSTLHYERKSDDTQLHLQYLIQTVQLKWQFRRCKRLLGIAEKRCQRLVDSSNEAVAYISRDLHLYANSEYLDLFDINSIHELPSLSVSDLILEDEEKLLSRFIKNESLHYSGHSLVASLRTINSRLFRASIQVIPTVFKGRKCLQLWVTPLDENTINSTSNISNSVKTETRTDKQTSKKRNALIFEQNSKSELLKPKAVTSDSILEGVIKRNEVTILVQQLTKMKSYDEPESIANHMLSLKIPDEQRAGINDLLFSADAEGTALENDRKVFWDKMMTTKIIQSLSNKNKYGINLFVQLSEAAITDKSFVEWFLPRLKKLGAKASILTFLLPPQLDDAQARQAKAFANSLRESHCKIALDDFSVLSESLRSLKNLKPDYVRLSEQWVESIEGNNKRELALGSFIRQLEAKNIQIIAPCGISKGMRRLFALSGASFCQERRLKTD